MKLCLFVLIVTVGVIETFVTKYCTKAEINYGECRFKGYEPAGGATNVRQIGNHRLEQESTVMNTIFGKTSHAVYLADAFTEFAGIFKTATRAVSPHMGVILAAFSAITSIGAAETTQSIVDQFNTVITNLVADINKSLLNMKGYVDDSIINLHITLITETYQMLWNRWLMCISRVTREDSDRCQGDVFDEVYSHKALFEKYADELKNGPLKMMEYREVEAKLPWFRVYVDLLLMILKALVKTYKELKDKASPPPNAEARYDRYKREMNTIVEKVVSYAKTTVDKIKAYHKGPDGHGDCIVSKMSCSPYSYDLWGGTYGYTHTCSCMVEDYRSTRCEVEFTVVVDRLCGGISDYTWATWYESPNRNSGDGRQVAALHFARARLRNMARHIVSRKETLMNRYWQDYLLKFVALWENAPASADANEESGPQDGTPRKGNRTSIA